MSSPSRAAAVQYVTGNKATQRLARYGRAVIEVTPEHKQHRYIIKEGRYLKLWEELQLGPGIKIYIDELRNFELCRTQTEHDPLLHVLSGSD